MTPDRKGRFKVFHKPKPGGIYALGCDVAEGLETGDYSDVFVLDVITEEQVANFHGHIDPDLFGEMICRIGNYYNNALVAVEVNNHGHSVLNTIKRRGYTNVYMRQVKEERGDNFTKKIGWQTNVKTKALLLDEFIGAIRDDEIIINDHDLLIEMTELYLDENGNCDTGGRDRVVAAGIAWQARKQVPKEIYKAMVPEERKKKYKNLIEKNKARENEDSYYS